MQDKKELNPDAQKAGYYSIFDITKAQITKVIEKLNQRRTSELEFDKTQKPLGFKTFRLQNSNFKQWNTDLSNPEMVEKQLTMHLDSVAENGQIQAMLYELLLKHGLPLTTEVQTIEAGEGNFYYVPDARLCLALEGFGIDTESKIVALEPKTVIILDRLFGKDYAISNTTNNFEALEIDFILL